MGEVERQDPSLKYNLKFNLKLEHVYGFQCFDRRECIKLTSDKFLIYPVGSRLVGMMLNSQEETNQSRISESEEDENPETKQAGLKMDHALKYFSYHQTAVSCFDLYDELEFKLIVSAEMTAENNIIVWDCENFSVKATLKSIFEKGVSKIKFSNKGKYIAVVGVSEDLTQVLTILNYQKIEAWAKSGRKDDKLESITKLGADPVLDLVFDSQDQSLYILAGKSLLAYHFSASGDIVEADWRGSEPELLTCLSFKKGRTILTGTISGNLIHWNGSEFNKSDSLHKRAINCMEKVDSESASFHYITGGDDCYIKFWTDDFKLEWIIDVNEVMLHSPHYAGLFPEVTSVSWKERTFVFSTRSGEIFQGEYPEEFYTEEQHQKPTAEKNTKMMQQLLESLRPIIIGHSDEEMTGIALCYSVREMFTIGSNNILMHWNYEKKKLLRRKKIDFPGKLLTISLNNSFLVVGCYNGTTLILNTSNLAQMHAHNIEKSEVSALTFSPSNENLVMGFVNGNVNILSTPQKFKLMHVLRSSYQNPVMALDFSDDNLLLKVTYKDLDAAVYDAVKGAKCNTGLDMSRFSPRGSNRNDLRWGQWRSPVGYSVQGIWGEYRQPSDIAGVTMNQDRDMVVVWDQHGGVKIYRYPVLNPQTPFIRISGSSGPISAALFDNDGNYLIILGSKDASISQYKVCRDDPKAVDKVMNFQRNFVDKQYLRMTEHQVSTTGQQPKGKQPIPFLKSLPMLWPSKPREGLMSKDFSCINLEILSGVGLNYQNFKEPILVASDETLVYFCGTTFVKHKISADNDIHAIQLSSRSYSQFHTKRVQSMDLSKSLKYVATGEAIDHKKPDWESEVAEVIVHDFQKAEIITKMKLTPGESSIYVKMNPSETQLLVISQTPTYQKLTIYDWINSASVQSVFIGTNKINDVAFASDEKFATVGNNHVIFWTLNGVSLTPMNGMYSHHEITEFSACAFAFEKKHLFTGTISGHLGMWYDNNYVNPVQAHKSPILLMKKFKKDSLFTADAEGVIFRWGFSSDLTKPSEVFDLKDMYSRPSRYLSINPSLQDVILVSENGDAIRAGTKNKPSKIFSDLTSKVTAVCLVDQELYILTESPFFFVYDIARQVLKPPKPVVDKSVHYTAIVAYFNQKKFVVADSKGYLRMFSEGLESQTAKQSTTLVQEGRIIHLLRVTQNETFLLAASMVEGGKIGLVSLGNQQLQVQIYLNPEIVGFVKAMDWDDKGDLFIVNSSQGELTVLSKDKKGVVSAKEAKDSVWLTHTTMFNFFSGGLHSKTDGSTDITAVYTRPELPFLLAGTESGGLFVERNPCVSFSKRKEVHQAHLGPVEEIQMSQKSQIVITRSADSVFVWRYSTRDSKWQTAKADLAPKLGQIGKAFPEIFRTSKALAGERPNPEFDFKKVVYKREAYDDPLKYRKLREARRVELKKLHHIKKEHHDGSEMDAIIQQLAQARSRSSGYSTLEKDASLAQFKQEILYHSTYLKKSAPEVKVKYLCSYGAETTEFRPTVHLFSNNQDILTFSKSFPTILCAFNQLRHDSHTSLVTSVAAHPNNTIIASSSEDSEIHIWEYNSNLLLSKFRAPITGGALKLSFSDNEKHLAGIFVQNNYYYLIVFDIHQQMHLAVACLGTGEVRSLMYKKKLEIVTVGENHLSNWKLHNGNLLGDSIDFKDYCSDLYSQGMNKLDMVIGTGNQSLLVLREVIHSELALNKTLEKPNVSVPAGARDSQNKRMSVLSKAVLSSSQGNKILGISVSNLYMFAGAEDSTVFVLSNNYIQLIVISLAELIPSALDPMLVAVSTNNNFQGFVVLLRSGELAITKTQDIRISYESRFESDVVRQSHFNRQPNTISRITQVRATKNEYVFASIAEDGTLRKWDFSGGLEHERIADLVEREEAQEINTPAITRKGEMGIGSSTLTCFDIQSDYAAIVGCGDGSLRVVFV